MSDGGDELKMVLPAAAAGRRLDVALAEALPGRSRTRLASLLKDGAILVDGRAAKPSAKVRGGERIEIEWPEPEIIEAVPEAIPLRVLYEDADLIAIHKPAGMPAHPGPGHARGTLVNALLAHCRDLSGINGALRPGIVHRLDMDTSGVIVAAKNDHAHQGLQEQFMARSVRKQYLALCHGHPARDRFACEGRIGRHPTRRTEMTVMRGAQEGREAHTDCEVLQRFAPAAGLGACCLVLAAPRTGRTHQIRVHLAKAGHPVLADKLYGKKNADPACGLERHALHAWKLELAHPVTGKKLSFVAPLDDDLKEALHRLGGAVPD